MPPSVGLLTVNVMVASDTILLPLQGECFAYKGVGRLLGIVQEARKYLNENLEIGEVFITQINTNRMLTKTIVKKLTEDLQDKIFDTKTRINVAVLGMLINSEPEPLRKEKNSGKEFDVEDVKIYSLRIPNTMFDKLKYEIGRETKSSMRDMFLKVISKHYWV